MARTYAAAIAAALLWVSIGHAQTVRLPAKVDLKAYRLTEPAILVEWEGDDAQVVPGSPEVVAFREYHPDPKIFMLRVVGYTKGSYNLTVVVAKVVDGKAVLAKGTTVVNVEGGATPVDPVNPVDPVVPEDDPVDPKDPDYPDTIDASLVSKLKTANWNKSELKRLAKMHVLLASVVKNSQNTQVKQVHALAASTMRDFGTEIPETVITILGSELNRVLPRDAEHVMTPTEIRKLRNKLLSIARALHSAGR